MIRSIQWILMGLLCSVALGCSTYIGNYAYSPQPAVTLAPPANQPSTQPAAGQPPPPQPPPPLAVLATVVGVHRSDRDMQIPDSVEVRVRLDNNGPFDVVFDPQTLELSNGQLVLFGPVIVRPPQPISMDPQQTAYLTVYFPFPAGHDVDNTDMETLQLRWRVQIGGQTLGQIAEFHRVWPYYYGPYYYSRPYYAYPVYPVVGIGIGFGYGHHWR